MNTLEYLKAFIEKQRAYASFFKIGSKSQEEFTVVSNLLESMAVAGKARYFNPSVAVVDPPDCVAQNSDGNPVAIEVTEVVCEETVRTNAQRDREAIKRMEPGAAVRRVWRQPDFIAHLDNRLKEKDSKRLKGGPYASYVVAMHTDEPGLEWENCEEWLREHTFGPFRQIRDAYLLFSYRPGVSYQYLHLTIARQGHAGDARNTRA